MQSEEQTKKEGKGERGRDRAKIHMFSEFEYSNKLYKKSNAIGSQFI